MVGRGDGKMLWENWEWIAQEQVAVFARQATLARRQILEAQEAFSLADGMGVHFGGGRNQASGIELNLYLESVEFEDPRADAIQGVITAPQQVPRCLLLQQQSASTAGLAFARTKAGQFVLRDEHPADGGRSAWHWN
jgi:hypothetical protein